MLPGVTKLPTRAGSLSCTDTASLPGGTWIALSPIDGLAEGRVEHVLARGDVGQGEERLVLGVDRRQGAGRHGRGGGLGLR